MIRAALAVAALFVGWVAWELRCEMTALGAALVAAAIAFVGGDE